MAARFRIDQTGPGEGTLDRTRTDLVPDEAIDLVVPDPVGGATYSWEILYKFGSTAELTAGTGTSTSIGPGGSVVPFCAFLIQLTETIGLTATKRKRIAAVRGSNGLRPLVFGETANPASNRNTRNPDDSTDNEERVDLDGVSGDNSQSWAGWLEALNRALEKTSAGGALKFSETQFVSGGVFVPNPGALLITNADTLIDLANVTDQVDGDLIGIKCFDALEGKIRVEFEGDVDGESITGNSAYSLVNNEFVILAWSEDAGFWVLVSQSICQRLSSTIVTGGTYNPSLLDERRTVLCQSNVDFQIEAQDDVLWRDGTVLRVGCLDGSTSFSVTGSGNNLSVPAGKEPESNAAGGIFEVHRIAENEWVLLGPLENTGP